MSVHGNGKEGHAKHMRHAQHQLRAASTTTFPASQVAQIEAEAQQLREAVIAKQGTIKSLERRISHLEAELQELGGKVRPEMEIVWAQQLNKPAALLHKPQLEPQLKLAKISWPPFFTAICPLQRFSCAAQSCCGRCAPAGG
jgi:septal ring factor EnvC (AmiA/AmiB activator)